MFLPRLLSPDVVAAIRRWPSLKRWERRELGQQLRRLGLTYREIQAVIPVAKGTLSAWCRDLPLHDDHEQRLAPVRAAAQRRRGALRRRRKIEADAEIRTNGHREAQNLLDDPFWVAGVVAYWGEGSKRSTRVQFSNSDPNMIRLFMAWSRRFLDPRDERYSVNLHLHSGQNESERIAFWAGVTALEPSVFGKSFIKPEGTGHRKNRLYNGTATVRLRRSTALLPRVLGWIDAVADPSGRYTGPGR